MELYYFNDYYKETVIDPQLKKILKSFHVDAGSNALIETISEKINHETPKIYQYALNHLNEWYANTVIGDKMKDLKAAVNMGAKPVLVRTGYGLTTEKDLNKFAYREIKKRTIIFDNLESFVESLE